MGILTVFQPREQGCQDEECRFTLFFHGLHSENPQSVTRYRNVLLSAYRQEGGSLPGFFFLASSRHYIFGECTKSGRSPCMEMELECTVSKLSDGERHALAATDKRMTESPMEADLGKVASCHVELQYG